MSVIDVIGWLIWVMVLLLGSSATIKNPIDANTSEFDNGFELFGISGHSERRVYGYILLLGCILTAYYPISKLHLLWWLVAALIIWMAMLALGQKLLVAGLLIFWGFRFWHLGWVAVPGNLRAAALLAMGVGIMSAHLGPTLSFGRRTKKGGLALLAVGTVSFLVFQLF